jgi:hypothetical protein
MLNNKLDVSNNNIFSRCFLKDVWMFLNKFSLLNFNKLLWYFWNVSIYILSLYSYIFVGTHCEHFKHMLIIGHDVLWLFQNILVLNFLQQSLHLKMFFMVLDCGFILMIPFGKNIIKWLKICYYNKFYFLWLLYVW